MVANVCHITNKGNALCEELYADGQLTKVQHEIVYHCTF